MKALAQASRSHLRHAHKGDPSGSDSAEASLKKHYYFVAPVELSLDSSNLKIASPVDAEPSFHPEPISPCVDPIVHFTIVNLPHQRNTQHNTLPTFQCACGQPESSLSKVQLYESLDDAKALVDELAVYSSGAQNSGFAAFRLSPGDRAVSLVDTSSSFYSHHVDRSFDSIVHFAIGSLRYQWDIQKDTLLTPLSVKSIIAPKLSNDQWYVNNEETQTDVDSVMQDDSDLESSPTYFTNSNSSASLDVAGTPSTSNSPQQHGLLPGVGYFEPSPSRQKIDQWVDEAVAKHQTTRDGTYLKCPEPECTHTARRPHALKTHIYTHYGIKPYMCTMCGISVLTEANRVRHIKNAHTCSGCKLVGSISTIKSHKAVCLPAATSSGPTRPNHTNRSPFIAPYLKF
ncbi:hypothetical protein V565_065070 [Rhizoctonia solani 123E]|uniref:C2H2-type domain-containing protein n=1 Tax=Rhizoctonia solani 123E TaxID=1423351 RepID=A0A074RWH9_9AGAM|nr:hypothetical protein V565_065070 [Rhizoctonia solani 123E]